jgi:hypothetical protein
MVMAAKLTRLTHKITIELHLMTESCTICSSRSRRTVRKLLDTPSYTSLQSNGPCTFPFLLHQQILLPKSLDTFHLYSSIKQSANWKSPMQNEKRIALRVKVKVKLFLCLTKHHARKAYWVSEGIASRII